MARPGDEKDYDQHGRRRFERVGVAAAAIVCNAAHHGREEIARDAEIPVSHLPDAATGARSRPAIHRLQTIAVCPRCTGLPLAFAVHGNEVFKRRACATPMQPCTRMPHPGAAAA